MGKDAGRQMRPETSDHGPAAALDKVVAANPDGMLVVGADESIRYVNPAAARLFGRDTAELLGQPFGLPIIPNEYAEVDVVNADGAPRVAEMRAVATEWRGEPAYVISLRDISQRRMLEAELRHAQKMESLGTFAGGITHAFNNLLTTVVGNCDLLSESLAANDPRRRYTAQIREVTERAAGLTEQLLAFCHQRPNKPERLDFNAVLTDMSALVARIIGTEIVFDAQVATQPAWVHIDRQQIEQVLLNLIMNARDAMPHGGRLTCSIYVDREHHVTLAVRDSGIGMDEPTRQRALEPFFTTKPDGHGIGLGLSTVYGIVHQAGGRVLIQSEPQVGTTVHVVLPYSAVGSAAPHERSVTERDDRASGSRRRACVLVVEDDEDVRDVVCDMLAAEGLSVVTAAASDEAIQVLESQGSHFDLVISDIVMPGGGGAELAAWATKHVPQLPFLFMTGYPKDALHLLTSDAQTDYLCKPFTSAALLDKVAGLLDSARAPQSSESAA